MNRISLTHNDQVSKDCQLPVRKRVAVHPAKYQVVDEESQVHESRGGAITQGNNLFEGSDSDEHGHQVGVGGEFEDQDGEHLEPYTGDQGGEDQESQPQEVVDEDQERDYKGPENDYENYEEWKRDYKGRENDYEGQRRDYEGRVREEMDIDQIEDAYAVGHSSIHKEENGEEKVEPHAYGRTPVAESGDENHDIFNTLEVEDVQLVAPENQQKKGGQKESRPQFTTSKAVVQSQEASTMEIDEVSSNHIEAIIVLTLPLIQDSEDEVADLRPLRSHPKEVRRKVVDQDNGGERRKEGMGNRTGRAQAAVS